MKTWKDLSLVERLFCSRYCGRGVNIKDWPPLSQS